MTAFNIADLFELVVDVVPEREALVCGDRRLTYGALEERANRLASWLASQGIGQGDHVGLYLYNSTEYIEGMLAAFKLRAVPINVNYRYVADELRYLFDDADLVAVIHEESFAPLVDEVRGDLPGLRVTLARGDAYEAALTSTAASDERMAIERSADDLYILYTGGTTGMPKGVMWRQEDIFFAAFAGGELARPEDIAQRVLDGAARRCLPACPFMHGTAHWMAFAALLGGGSVVVSDMPSLDPALMWELVARERVTFLVIVGDAFARPMVEALQAAPSPFDLSALSVVLSGGAILSPTVKDALLGELPGVIVVDGYGASETGGQGQMVAAPGAAGTAGDSRPRFQMGADTMVVDDDLRPVPPGSAVVGRIARRGRVPLGYYKDDAKSAATFPVIDGVRWSVPGDNAMVEENGTIVLLGRGSVSINTGGEKVFPEEVEAVLKSHDSIFDAVVVGLPDPRWGQRVTAVVALRRESAKPSLDDVAAHCRASLAGYKVPRALVTVDTIVRSPSGKPDYRWAREVAEKSL